MRQTSRAVALLLALESANAQPITAQVPNAIGFGGDYQTVFNPANSNANPTNELALNSRTAGYTGAPRVYGKTASPLSPAWTVATFRTS